MPADLGLERDVTLVGVYGQHVQGASRSAVKVRTIQEDAGILHQLGDYFSILLHSRGARVALGLELPLIIGESLGGLLDPATVLFVSEVGPVAAASLDQFGRGTSKNALAAVTEDAGPVTFEERHVKHPRSLVLVVLETDPLVGISWY